MTGYVRSSSLTVGYVACDSEFYVATYTKKVDACDMILILKVSDRRIPFFSITTMKAYMELMKKHVSERIQSIKMRR